MKAIQTHAKIAEWNTQLAHKLRVACETIDQLKTHRVLWATATFVALGVGFVVGVLL